MENRFVANIMRSFQKNIRSYTLIIALVVIWAVFGIANPNFLSGENVSNVIRQMAIIAIMACGMVYVIVTGGIDLSVGYGAGFVSVVSAALQYYFLDSFITGLFPGIDPVTRSVLTASIAVITGVGVGIAIGAFQGAMVAYFRVPAFIVTLGGMFIWKSGILLVTEGKSLKLNNTVYAYFAQGKLPELMGLIIAGVVVIIIFAIVLIGRGQKIKYGIAVKPVWMDLAKAALFGMMIVGYVLIVNTPTRVNDDPSQNIRGGLPLMVLILGIIAVFMSYISFNTRFGRYSYAIGGNREAARLSGINIKKTIFTVFISMGTLMGIAGVLLASDVGAGTTNAGGSYELDVIASCILGGTSTLGGEGTVFGALVGALIMQSLSNGLQMMNVNSNWQYLIKGVVLILAVLLDINMKKKKA